MEDSGGVDDQGSGWFEVKKKHRSSSKLSLQSWVGGFSGKSSSNSLRSPHPVNKIARNDRSKSQPPTSGGSSVVHTQSNTKNSITTSTGDYGGSHCPDKCMVRKDTEFLMSSDLHVTNSHGGSGDCEKVSPKDMPGVVQKIKWGDLEDDSLLLNNSANEVDIKFGNIGEVDLGVSEKNEVKHDLASHVSSFLDTQVNKVAAVSVREEEASHQVFLSTNEDKSCRVSHLDLKREFIEDLESLSNSEATVCPVTDDSNCIDIGTEHNKLVNDISSNFNFPSCEEAGTEPKVQKADKLPEVENPELHEKAAGQSEFSSSSSTVQDAELISTENSRPENSGGSSDLVEGAQMEQGSVTHNVPVVSVPSEGETGESKERFRQRLWCFLFENLNRAIDELYLLCELECDLEQMKEAILVLEEAASDFKELNARVEEFEAVKKLSSQSVDGMPISMKSDHCRPHALSWEVRRMTNSPHKAEILSSSLEAFKKIRQERANMLEASKKLPETECLSTQCVDQMTKPSTVNYILHDAADSALRTTENKGADLTPGSLGGKEKNIESISTEKVNGVQNGRLRPQNPSPSSINSSKPPLAVKFKREQLESDLERLLPKRERALAEGTPEKNQKAIDHSKRQATVPEKDKEKEKRNMATRRSMDAWKEKRNWEDILSSSVRISSRVSHLPGLSRKSAERVRVLHDKLMSPDKKKKTSLDVKREAEEKHARAMKIRSELENERVQKLQRTSEKLNRVNEWQAVRTMKLREGMHARHQRSESRHEAFLAQVAKRAGDESSKVNEVRFITSLNEENKKIMLRQKLHGSELRRAEKLHVMKIKQKEDMAREEAVLERKKLIEAEKLQRLAETQRKKEEAHVRREEERKASSAAREARAMEQLRRKEERARAQQEEAELMAQKLAERLSESEQRRKFYLEQIRERASMDFRDQSSPLLRRYMLKDGQSRSTPNNNGDEQGPSSSDLGSGLALGKATMQQHMKRRIKRIRQRLMALKYEFIEPVTGAEIGIGYRTSIGTARAKIGRWLQELQKLRQARKEGAASLGLIIAEMIKYLEGRELELQASRQAGLLDFIASALPASHTSKPEACQVMIHLLKLLRVVLSTSANRSYFLAQNLLPPIVPMLSTALENYIKIAASVNAPGNVLPSSKTSIENFESSSEVLDGSLWIITTIIGHISPEGPQLQMWDGLLELLVAYQVIHRLRDLFALYDRPQVEGSPFPSSILLSIRLLVALTSRPGADSTINYVLPASEKLAGDASGIVISAEPGELLGAVPEDGSPSESGLKGGKIVQKTKIAIDKLDDESCEKKKNDGVISSNGGQRKQTDCSIMANGVNLIQTDIQDEPQDSEVISKPFVSLGDQKQPMDLVSDQRIKQSTKLKPSIAYLLSAISDTGIVGLLSLLTAVLLQANNRLSSEQASYILPSNFEDVATGVLKVLNNLAFLDLKFMQRMLARPDLKMEFFHLMSFLLSHCSSKWTAPSDPIGLLLLESLSILGHFALLHPENQEVLRWGKSPTILHKVCDLPFVFFSDPELMPVLASTLVAACYGCEQNKSVVQQELSMDMLLSLLKSCKNNLPVPGVQSTTTQENEESNECNPNGPELRKPQMDGTVRASRNVSRTTRTSLGRPGGGSSGNIIRSIKIRNQRDNRSARTSDEIVLKQNQPALEVSSVMLHYRFPSSFIDRAEQFFSAGTSAAV